MAETVPWQNMSLNEMSFVLKVHCLGTFHETSPFMKPLPSWNIRPHETSALMKLPLSWNFPFHETFPFMKLPLSWNFPFHETSPFMKLPPSWNFRPHKTSPVMKLPPSWNFRPHEMYSRQNVLYHETHSVTKTSFKHKSWIFFTTICLQIT